MKDYLSRSLRRLTEASNRAAARVERLREFDHITTRESLLELVGKKLKDRQLLLVSNREPYAHVMRDGKITVIRNAGGLTIALDSIARAFHSLWVCHGAGAADFEVAGPDGLVAVPPGEESYKLKRLALEREEEKGYYEGFSNETLWPLCHVSYVRPKFHPADWETYDAVNRKFAEAVADSAEPGALVFLQDYHLSRVALHLKALRPDLVTVLFWHIPWPNPEIFRILPWKKEILEGLLANDILGFHLKYHSENFLDTVDSELETRIDWERHRVSRGDRVTQVRYYPISIDFDSIFRQSQGPEVEKACKELSQEPAFAGQKLILGVDRLDYTKGIPERLDALDRLLDLYPEYHGRIKFLQIGVPSRTGLEDYQQVVNAIEERCAFLNAKHGKGGWEPVIFLKGHQDFDTLLPYYRLADVCVVSSLHDGMNLVAKEFVASSSNDRGVLVLSPFTGAARELEQALLVNPYDMESFAQTLRVALEMPAEEQKARLDRMRLTVAENNIYSWAQQILTEVIHLAEDQALERGTA
ncbi:MAG TPA: trehalose-6-phosphate synthase [bacterium]|nr:trehalose-6-phosphate synthase [bacterium]